MRAIRYKNPHDYKYLLEDYQMIKALNLTVSQTLCNAIVSCFDIGKKTQFIQNFITINEFIKKVYVRLDDVGNNILKYNTLSKQVNSIQDLDMKRSLNSVKGDLLKTVELMKLLNLKTSDFIEAISSDRLLNEVVSVLSKVENDPCFDVGEPNFDAVEIKVGDSKESPSIIYVHGVHQFTPIMLLTFEKLESFGFEVVFVYNYNSDFPRIYSTWERVYGQLNLESVIDYSPKETVFENKHINIAYYLEGQIQKIKKTSGLELMNFTTITNLTQFVKEEYEFGVDEKNKVMIINKNSQKSPVSYMNRQFYGINGASSNTFLKIMYPDQFKERHFLSYPMGQFIMGMYNCWDKERNDLIVSQQFEPVLAYDIWNLAPITMFRKLAFYIKEDLPLETYIEKINNIKQNLRDVNYFIKRHEGLSSIKKYNKIIYFNYSVEELESYAKVLREIKDLVTRVLGFDKDQFNIIKHMSSLMMYVETNKAFESNEDEKLINILKGKMNDITSDSITGSVDDLKESMFILYQASQSSNSANWIIRDFEQLDGEVFHTRTKNNIIHLTQLSDDDIESKVKKSRIWPLDDLLDKSQLINEKVTLYHKAKNEYPNLIRFMFFYTIFYSRKEIELSYVGFSLGKKMSPFYFLEDLGYKIPEKLENLIAEDKTIKERKNLIKEEGCVLRKKFKYMDPLSDYFDDEVQINRFIQSMIQFTFADFLISQKKEKPRMSFTDEQINDIITMFDNEFKVVLNKLFSEMPQNVFLNLYSNGINNFKDYTLKYVKKIVESPRINTYNLQRHKKHAENKLDRLYDEFKKSNNLKLETIAVNMYHESYSYICKNCSYRTKCLAGYMKD